MRRAAVVATLLALAAPALLASAGAEGAQQGQEVFRTNCRMCHNPASNEAGIGPGLKGLFKNKKMPASGRPVTEEAVRAQILEGGNGMPPFEGRLDAAEVDALIAYLKTL